jgi:RNAse (barnase) inhibitor barstar
MKSIETINGRIYFVATVNALKCITEKGLLKEFANCFDFPDYFGWNLDALDECMRDLDWLKEKNYKIIVRNMSVLKKKDIKQADQLEKYLNFYKDYWDAEKKRLKSDLENDFIVEYE